MFFAVCKKHFMQAWIFLLTAKIFFNVRRTIKKGKSFYKKEKNLFRALASETG